MLCSVWAKVFHLLLANFEEKAQEKVYARQRLL